MRTLSLLALLVAALAAAVISPRAWAQNVTVRVTIQEVRALTNFDGLDEADWYATVFIDGTEFDNEDLPEAEDLEGNDHIFPDWSFQKSVPLSAGSVSVSIEIRDEDDFLKLSDDLADINPASGKAHLDLTVPFAPCAVGGDVIGPCRQGLVSFSNGPEDGDGRAEIRFKIEVLGVPGLHARCTHQPIWPQPGESVTLKVDALDGNLNLRSADLLGIDLDGAPDNTVANQESHTVTFTPTGGEFVYECRMMLGGDEVFSGGRRVLVGDPPPGERAVPVLFNQDKAVSVDILLIPDQDSYSGTKDPLFLDHAANTVYDLLGGLYSERIFLERQHFLNVYLALDSGEAKPFDSAIGECEHVAPANLDPDYLFSDARGIIHSDLFVGLLRDCARGSDKVFSANPPKLSNALTLKRVFVHELGHRPFGLADEYCNQRPGSKTLTCDGGYFQPAFFPNVFTDTGTCEADAASEGFGMVTCDEWIDDDGDGPFSTYDPAGNDLMNDNGDAQFLDLRRIEGVIDNDCVSGGC